VGWRQKHLVACVDNVRHRVCTAVLWLGHRNLAPPWSAVREGKLKGRMAQEGRQAGRWACGWKGRGRERAEKSSQSTPS
jgi:hypothetical protein